MIGYKVFNKDLKCRNYEFRVGEVFKHEGKLEMCNSGFHFCEKLVDCFSYYDFDPSNRVCRVIAVGNVDCKESGDSKYVTDELYIEEELTWVEVLEMCNSGKGNSGLSNSGHYNSGNRNSGHCNSGDNNSGNSNSGYSNSGNHNSGHSNSGHSNSGNYNSGFFNTDEPTVRMFNKDTNLKRSDLDIPYINLKLTEWISESDMTEVQKQENPDYKTTQGFLLKRSYKEAWNIFWSTAEDGIKKRFLELPNFDVDIFEEITGINL